MEIFNKYINKMKALNMFFLRANVRSSMSVNYKQLKSVHKVRAKYGQFLFCSPVKLVKCHFLVLTPRYVHVQKLTLKSINPQRNIHRSKKRENHPSLSWLPLAAQTRHTSLKVFNLLLMKVKQVQIKDNEWWKYMSQSCFLKCSMYIIILHKPCWHFKSHICAAIVKIIHRVQTLNHNDFRFDEELN